jgi:ubiquinone/menaquinone biosynthesis C-methylase UbiE
MPTAKDYVLGTHQAEITRLGLQHQVWRPYVLDAWSRAGMTRGSKVIDFGAGPGYATMDAADIVGPGGSVVALERSPQFVAFARQAIDRREAHWVRMVACDLMNDPVESADADIAWCRWVASFVTRPETLIEKLFGALRVGGKAVLHEYQQYSTWRTIPPSLQIDSFVAEVMASWRASGGEPDIIPSLLPQMTDIGFKVREVRPLIFAVHPSHFTWQWPAAFVSTNAARLVELGRVSQEWAEAVEGDFSALAANPNAILVTPLVMEIIAEK